MKNQERMDDLRHKVNMYFDNELSQEDKQDVLRRVDDDPRFQRIFNKEKTFRDFIKNNVTRPAVSPDLIQTIKDRIKTY